LLTLANILESVITADNRPRSQCKFNPFYTHILGFSSLHVASPVLGFRTAAMVCELTHSNATSGTRHISQDVS
jgi:hypothetical protein